MGSPTRAVRVGGRTRSGGDIINSLTISSTRNAIEFGEMDSEVDFILVVDQILLEDYLVVVDQNQHGFSY